MKKIYLLSFLSLSFIYCGCGIKRGSHNIQTLKDTYGWTVDTIAKGYIWYNYTGFYENYDSNQTVNVIEIDLQNKEYSIEFVYDEKADSLSSFAEKYDAVAGINGTYFEPDVSFVKTGNKINCEVSIPVNHIRFWKHKAAIFYNNKTRKVEIKKGTNASYKKNPYPQIMSGAPLLIDNYNPVGIDFTGNLTNVNINDLDYEDYRRHQGVRHPRVAIAITKDSKLLLITVDGRWQTSQGMTAKELTRFLQYYLNPKSALNLDGGGSTSMWIKDRGTESHIVNYPTDNKRYDHFGQRMVNCVILIKKR